MSNQIQDFLTETKELLNEYPTDTEIEIRDRLDTCVLMVQSVLNLVEYETSYEPQGVAYAIEEAYQDGLLEVRRELFLAMNGEGN